MVCNSDSQHAQRIAAKDTLRHVATMQLTVGIRHLCDEL
jgi:hypothetical protein